MNLLKKITLTSAFIFLFSVTTITTNDIPTDIIKTEFETSENNNQYNHIPLSDDENDEFKESPLC